MQWANWETFYEKIIIKLEIDPKEDFEATRILQSYFHDRTRQVQSKLTQLKDLCQKICIVFGAGPSLSSDLSECLQAGIIASCTTITADGATSEFVQRKIIPSIIVTDLDGDMNHIETAARKGSILVVHAHGDNKERISKWIPRLLKYNLIPTTQVEPISPLENFGGFTDGDRAVFMAIECGCPTLALAGFDLGEVVGQSSKPEFTRDTIATPRKKVKLEIAAELLQEIKKNKLLRKNIAFFNLTSKSAVPLEGYTPISPREFASFIHSSESMQ